MLDIGVQELLVLMVIALLVFGPDKLPELGRRLGRAMREFRRASDEFRSTIETNLNLNEEPPLPPSAALPSPTPESPAVVTPVEDRFEGAPSSDAAPAVAAAAGPDVVVAVTEPYSARRGGRLLHRTTCAWVVRIPDSDRIVLKAPAEGWELGLRACPVCEPRDEEG
jgi:TatA/E family protein of Tat protein translocase